MNTAMTCTLHSVAGTATNQPTTLHPIPSRSPVQASSDQCLADTKIHGVVVVVVSTSLRVPNSAMNFKRMGRLDAACQIQVHDTVNGTLVNTPLPTEPTDRRISYSE